FAFALPAEVPEDGRVLDITLLVTDYDLPGENGVAFADRLHAARPDVPVVLVTAFRTHAVDAQAVVRPFLTVLSKPLDYDQFHVLLHELIASGPLATRCPGGLCRAAAGPDSTRALGSARSEDEYGAVRADVEWFT